MIFCVAPLSQHRSLCDKLQVQAIILVGTGPHQLEYPQKKFQLRHYISNFFGSAGTLVLYQHKNYQHAALWTDGRYEEAAQSSIKKDTTLFITKEQDWEAQILWLADLHKKNTLNTNLEIAISNTQISISNFEKISAIVNQVSKHYLFEINLLSLDYMEIYKNIIMFHPDISNISKNNTKTNTTIRNPKFSDISSSIWNLHTLQSRHPLPSNQTDTHNYSTSTILQRLTLLSHHLQKLDAKIYLSANIHELAWLTNLRSMTLDYLMLFPCVFSFHRIQQKFILWIQKKLQTNLTFTHVKLLENQTNITIQLKDYDQLFIMQPKTLQMSLTHTVNPSDIVYDKTNIPYALYCSKFRFIQSPIALWKSIRTIKEIENSKHTYLIDNIALLEAMAEISEQLQNNKPLTEHDASEIILFYRKQQPLFLQLSFNTILASGEHSALPHYAGITPSPLIDTRVPLLIDSGAHYLYGTTDMTRVYYFGNYNQCRPPVLFIEDFTLVLKSHIVLAQHNVSIDPKTNMYPLGSEIDAIARSVLDRHNRLYNHGTGHGIGYCTDVHEGVQSFSSHSSHTIVPNMLISNEPGFYRPKKWGVRIENIVATMLSSDNKLSFDTISYFPIQNSLINYTLLSKSETNWINEYQNHCKSLLLPHISTKATKFLHTLLA